MSMKNGLGRHYDKLGPEERFRLDVLAMARGDDEESERLANTCPRYTYTMNDRAFVGRWVGTVEMTVRVFLHHLQLLCKLQMVEAFRVLIPYMRTLTHDAVFEAYFDGHRAGSFHAWNAAGKEGRPPAWPDLDSEEPDEREEHPAISRDMEELEFKVNKYSELLPEMMDRLERELGADAYGVWMGFKGFCEENLEVEAKKVLKAVMDPNPALERVERLEVLAERLALEPDPETATTLREGLAESWSAMVKRGG